MTTKGDLMIDFTVNEMGNEIMRRLEEKIRYSGPGQAGRDFWLAKTHLEDALTRYNSGRYHENGTWVRRDPDFPDPTGAA